MKRKILSIIISVVIILSFYSINSSIVFAEEATEKISQNMNDQDIGLRNMVIDSSNKILTNDQKMLIGYFDRDYMIYDREFFERYENFFVGCKLYSLVKVKKIVSREEDSVTFVAAKSARHSAYADVNSYIMYITCPKLDIGIMEGDEVSLYGTFQGMRTEEIDGATYNLACIDANNRTHVDNGNAIYDYNSMKKIATTMFGENIRVDKVSDEFYNVFFEDQSNINFSKIEMSAYMDGYVGSTPMSAQDATGNYYNIIVASDFEHYYYVATNSSTNQTTLAYYDKSIKKIWQREFENTENIAYDYTKNNFYLALNNNLYIINAETGEDVYAPSYVGPISDVRKAQNGVYLVRKCGDYESTKSDVVMKLDNTGQRIWSTNFDTDFSSKSGFQILDDIVLVDYYGASSDENIAVIDAESGNIIQTCAKTNIEAYNMYTTTSDSDNSDISGNAYIWTVIVDPGYLALRTDKAFDASNEIGELYTGDTVEVIDASDAVYWYVYSYTLCAYGYVNCNYLYR